MNEKKQSISKQALKLKEILAAHEARDAAVRKDKTLDEDNRLAELRQFRPASTFPHPAPTRMAPPHAAHESSLLPDLSCTSELRSMWTQYNHIPEVREAFRHALADNSISQQEMTSIYTSIAHTLTVHQGGLQAFRLEGPDPRILNEIEEALEKFPENPALDEFVETILSDGIVSPEELATLRELVSGLSANEPEPPQPRPLAPMFQFPKLELRPPNHRKDKDEHD